MSYTCLDFVIYQIRGEDLGFFGLPDLILFSPDQDPTRKTDIQSNFHLGLCIFKNLKPNFITLIFFYFGLRSDADPVFVVVKLSRIRVKKIRILSVSSSTYLC